MGSHAARRGQAAEAVRCEWIVGVREVQQINGSTWQAASSNGGGGSLVGEEVGIQALDMIRVLGRHAEV